MSIFRRKILSSNKGVVEKKHIYPSDWFGIGNDIELKNGEFLLFKGIKHNATESNWYLLDCSGDAKTNSSNYYYFMPSDPSDILYILSGDEWVETPKYSDTSIIGNQPTLSSIYGSVGIFLTATGKYLSEISFWWNMVEITEHVKKIILTARNKYVATQSSNAVYQIPIDIQNAYKGFAIQCRSTLRCDGKQTRGENGGITFRFGTWCSYQQITVFTITADTEVGESKETFTRWLYKNRSRESTSVTFAEIRFSKTDSAGYEIASDVRLFARPMD